MERAAEDPTRGETWGGDDVTIDLRALEVDVLLPGGDTVRVDPRQHRDDVVRRLLLLGVSGQTLTALLPEWDEGIRRVAEELRADGLL
jgi:hypothetical protein